MWTKHLVKDQEEAVKLIEQMGKDWELQVIAWTPEDVLDNVDWDSDDEELIEAVKRMSSGVLEEALDTYDAHECIKSWIRDEL